MCRVETINFHSSTCGYLVFMVRFVKDAVFSLVHIFGSFFKYQVTVGACTYIWNLDFISMINTTVLY